MLARLGGDEFAAIIVDVANAQSLGAIADALCDVVRETPLATRGEVLDITVCVGGAVSDGWSDSDLLRRAADSALYIAKGQGRDRSVVGRDEFEPQPTGAF